MRKRLSLLLLCAAMVSCVAVSADAQSSSGSTTLRVRGTIDQYDAATRILSLSTANGRMRLVLASTARIRQGWHKLDPLELRKLAGYRAAIGYSDSGGNKTVESVHVFGKNERIER